MKLDYDCVRDVLLAAENLCSLDDEMLFSALVLDDFAEVLPNRSKQEIFYTLLKLSEAGYIKAYDKRNDRNGYTFNKFIIEDITYKGHEYLATVKNVKIWSKIKEQLPYFTLSLIEKVGASLITSGLLP